MQILNGEQVMSADDMVSFPFIVPARLLQNDDY